MDKRNISIGIGSMAFGTLFFIMAFSIKEAKASTASASLFPKIISAALIVLGALLLLREYVQAKNGREKPAPLHFGNPRLVIASIAAMVLYAMLLKVFGFIACTFLYLSGMMYMLEPDKKTLWKKALISAVLTAAIYVMFGNFFNATLPVGVVFGG